MDSGYVPTIHIRADADPRRGTGHVMRCLALAQAAHDAGMDVRFSGRVDVPWVLERLREEGIPFTALFGAIPEHEHPETLLADIGPCGGNDWVVLDGYHFGPDCHKAVRDSGCKLLLIDDYAHLPEYSCDILLNQNLGAETLVYAGDIKRFLLGPHYALLRPEFAEARERAIAKILPPAPHIILLTLGGGNFIEYLRRIASCFMLPELAGRAFLIVRGSMNVAEIHAALQGCPADIEVLQQVDDMSSLLLNTDLCVTAGGSTCWELCCLGVPFLTVAVAKNQRFIVERLQSQDIASPLTPDALRNMMEKTNKTILRSKLFEVTRGDGALAVLQRFWGRNV